MRTRRNAPCFSFAGRPTARGRPHRANRMGRQARPGHRAGRHPAETADHATLQPVRVRDVVMTAEPHPTGQSRLGSRVEDAALWVAPPDVPVSHREVSESNWRVTAPSSLGAAGHVLSMLKPSRFTP